jgi:hypothetical protein
VGLAGGVRAGGGGGGRVVWWVDGVGGGGWGVGEEGELCTRDALGSSYSLSNPIQLGACLLRSGELPASLDWERLCDGASSSSSSTEAPLSPRID